MGYLYQILSPQGSENPVGGESERLEQPVGMEDTKEIRPSEHSRTHAQMNSQIVVYAQGLLRSALAGFPVLREVLNTRLHL